jgi:hypothetical protein
MWKCIRSLFTVAVGAKRKLELHFFEMEFLRQYKGLILKKSTNDTRRGTRVSPAYPQNTETRTIPI